MQRSFVSLCRYIPKYFIYFVAMVNGIVSLISLYVFSLLLYRNASFYHKWMLNFVKGFLCIYWDNHMDFIFQFVNVVYYIVWFVDIEESLHPWDKAHLVTMYDILTYCWILFARILLRIFTSKFISDIGLQFSFLFFWWHLCLVLSSRSSLGWWWPQNEFRSLPSSANFWKGLSRIGVSSSLNFW